VVAYNRGSVPEVVDDGLTGFIVEDEISAVGAVKRLSQLSRPAIRKHFEKRFTARRMHSTTRGYRRLTEARAADQAGQQRRIAPRSAGFAEASFIGLI